MPRDARETKESLLKAGAHLFATEGVDAARTRDIVAAAGQGNDSAIAYHFGSRQGLLAAILRAGVERMEPARAASLETLAPPDSPAGPGSPAGSGLRAIVAAIVEPTADELHTPEGRDFLRIISQVAGQSGIRGHRLPALLDGTAIARQLLLLEQSCLSFLPEPYALERVAAFIAFLTAALADRAATSDKTLLEHDAFTTNMVDMLTAALRA